MGLQRKGRPSGVQRKSALGTTGNYVKAYIPLFLAFLVLFGGLWAWVSFGPHSPTAQDHWTQIENQYMPQREAARQKVTDSLNDFKAQIEGYKDFRDQTRNWMKALADVGSWDNPKAAKDVNVATNDAVQAVITAGNDEATVLDGVVAAKTPNDVIALRQQIESAEQTFATQYAIARSDIFPPVPGSTPSATPTAPTLAVPSGSLSPTDTPADTSSPIATNSPAPPASASLSPSPQPS